MDAAGADWGSFAVFNAEDWELLWFDVRRDDVFVDEMLVTAEAFWHNHVLTRVRPEAEDATPAALRVRQLVRDTTRANEVWREDGTWMSAFAELRVAKRVLTEAEARHETAVRVLKDLMDAEGQTVVASPLGRISWSESTRRNFSRELLAEAHPELDLSPFYTTTATRSFRPTFAPDE
jgi:hypothetical protein